MEIIRMPVGIYAANCYIVYCDDTKEAIIIDPGGDGDEIVEKAKELGLKVKFIILTHGHGDHISGLGEVKEVIKAPVLIHEKDKEILKDAERNLSSGMFSGSIEFEADDYVKDGDKLVLGNLTIEIIHTPGHTPGGISLKIGNSIFSGDTLFAGSIGRTDFPGGSFKEIISSIKEKLLIYPDDIVVYPGHGPSTTLGREKAYNPFVK